MAGNAVDNFTGTSSIDIGEGRSMNLYKAKDVSITITRADGSTVVLRNFQNGDMVTPQKTNNKIDAMSDPQGSPAASVTYDALGTLQTTIQQGSPTNNMLSDCYNSDEVFGFWVAYGDERTGGDHCMITKSPDAPFGKDVPTRQWAVTVFDYKYDGNANA